MALIVRLARDATAVELTPREVCFAHAAPPDLMEHRRFFGAPLKYGARLYTVAFTDSDGERALRSADEALATIVRKRLDKALFTRDHGEDVSTSSRVRHLLINGMGHVESSIVSVGRTWVSASAR